MAREKILIVDDEQDFVTTVKYFFEQNGYEVASANNGIDALNKAKEGPDIILLDLRLPGMNGFEILHKLHTDPACHEIPVIILSAVADMKSIHEAQGRRATDYIIKTESLEKMLIRVRKYIFLHNPINSKPRQSGINVLQHVTWGQHICALYGSKKDLLSLLVPYFKAGLLNNELCVWSLSESLTVDDARALLSKEIPNLRTYIENGQMRIVDGRYIYDGPEGFDTERAFNFWDEEEEKASDKGFDGMRISGSGNWAYGPRWQALCDYEKRVNGIISSKKMIAICTYSLHKFSMAEIIAVGAHHEVIIAKQLDKVVKFHPTSEEIFLEYLDAGGKGIKD